MGRRGRQAGSVADRLTAEFGKPEPADWHKHYTPERLAGYVAEVADLEAQLDEHWEGWRKREPFTTVDAEKRAWIKLRLKRREQIITGQGAWGVHIVWKDDQPFAVPVRPPRRGEPSTPAFRVVTAVPMLADRLKLPVSKVQAALDVMPLSERDAALWVSGHVVAGSGGSASLPAAAPPPVATPAGVA